MKLRLGKKSMHNILRTTETSENSISPSTGQPIEFHDQDIDVDVVTLDSLTEKHVVDPARLRLISLQINGAELDALRGARRLIDGADDIGVLLSSGRQSEGAVGLIDGEPDHVVVTRELEAMGFRTRTMHLYPDQTKQMMIFAAKGNMNAV